MHPNEMIVVFSSLKYVCFVLYLFDLCIISDSGYYLEHDFIEYAEIYRYMNRYYLASSSFGKNDNS